MRMRPMATSTRPHHIDVRLPVNTSSKQERELGAFARYCVQRIEKDLGERQQWVVEIDLGGRGYSAVVEVQHRGTQLETRGYGQDGPLAIWDAMCRMEQELRHSLFATRAAND